jgi:hypothetical protein
MKFFAAPAVGEYYSRAGDQENSTNDQDDDDSSADACIRYEYRRRRTTGVQGAVAVRW